MHAPSVNVEIEHFTIGIGQQIGLLAFQHLQVFGKNFALPSRMAAVSALSLGLNLRAIPQKYQIEVSVSGVIKSTTMLEAFLSSGAS